MPRYVSALDISRCVMPAPDLRYACHDAIDIAADDDADAIAFAMRHYFRRLFADTAIFADFYMLSLLLPMRLFRRAAAADMLRCHTLFFFRYADKIRH